MTLGPAYCRAILGLKVDAITTADIVAVLKPVWGERSETASRLRGRIERVLAFAEVRGWRPEGKRDNSISRCLARISAWRGARWPRKGTCQIAATLRSRSRAPLNARQEAFARNIAEGRSQREAYQCAGYTPASDSVADVNASRLLRHAQVQSRVQRAPGGAGGSFPDHGREASGRAGGGPQPGAQPRPGGRRRGRIDGTGEALRLARRPPRGRDAATDTRADAPAEVAVEVWLREVAPPTGG